ncbi:hypothetical protein SAMN04487957_103117 [Halomonas shengliensis]|uniref:DUF7281 domain-containing protein n=1 Tax=Halomonas shengliensis TaxID=419597 RepID=A0A1H0G962_9GAMM|nr:hypothetical protein [Halomonas shengliensis]SDO03445.1 hypothetical protein SAMN04487957_103117 [Halomonas shengliensis]
MPLSSRARRLLRDTDLALRSTSRVEKPRGKAVEEVVAWCQAQDIELGSRLSHGRLVLDRDLLAHIDEALAALGEPAIAAELGGLTSVEQAALGNREAKGVRSAPRERRVLASLPAVNRPGVACRGRDHLDLDWHELDLAAFDVLVQVENLDSFYALQGEPPALSPWPRPLVLYRGDRHYGGGFADLARAWSASHRPHLYLGDFDAKGVSIALAGAASHLLLPPLAVVAARANPQQLPAEQQAYQAALRDHAATLPAGHPLAGYLALLLGEQRGLLQQWFGSGDDWVVVPLHARTNS